MAADGGDSLKDRLIQQARQRRQAGTEPAGAAGTPVSEAYLRFDTHDGYRQVQTLREGARRLGIEAPYFRVHDGPPGPTTVIDGRDCLDFANYNYLGLAGDPRVNRAAKDAVDRYGTSPGASRAVAGERPFHRRLEAELAAVYGAEDAVAFVSGHATNVSTIGYLMGPRDLVVHDELCHNSAVVGAELAGAQRLTFAHNDPEALAACLAAHRGRFERALIVVEGLYSMDGDSPDLTALTDIKRRHGAWLMVDEAHALGVLGASGCGLHEHCGVDPGEVDIWMGTLSKTLAACGGFIAGSAVLVDLLRNLAPGFLYSVGLPAQLAEPARAALAILRQEPERVARLQARGGLCLDYARRLGLDTGTSNGHAVVPVITGSSVQAARLSSALLERGINIQPILHPAVPENSARLRLFLSSEHTEEQITYALEQLRAAM